MPIFRLVAGMTIVALLAASVRSAYADDAIAPDDPRLISKTTDICLLAALSSGGIDKKIREFCQCAAPILSRHMTPSSRYQLLVEQRTDLRPEYDDPNGTYADVLKACPPGK